MGLQLARLRARAQQGSSENIFLPLRSAFCQKLRLVSLHFYNMSAISLGAALAAGVALERQGYIATASEKAAPLVEQARPVVEQYVKPLYLEYSSLLADK